MDDNPLDKPAHDKPPMKTLSFKDFSMKGKSKELLDKMGKDQYVLSRIAIKGQSTLIYAEPNAGKTLLTLQLLIDAIESEKINPSHVYYLNLDDHGRGFAEKAAIADQYGFHMIGGGFEGSADITFTPDMLEGLLVQCVESSEAPETIVILDTVKKFVDHMDKKSGRKFGIYTRPFVSQGGTLIMLSHVNKHKDSSGKSVYAGTTDLLDDADCAYTLEVSNTDNSTRTATFEHQKSRGDTSLTESYRYTKAEGQSYTDLLSSISAISKNEAAREQQKAYKLQFVRENQNIIDEIIACILGGITLKTELVKEVTERTAESRRKVIDTLHRCNGDGNLDYWSHRTVRHNGQDYYLNGRAKEFGGSTYLHTEKRKPAKSM